MKKYNITVNGNAYEVVVEEVEFDGTVAAPVVPAATPVTTAAPAATTAPKVTAKPAAATAAGAVKVTAPMPGTILEIKVSAGQSVKKGDTICVLEAMKMENDIPAPQDGVIASVVTTKGASVGAGDVLVTLA